MKKNIFPAILILATMFITEAKAKAETPTCQAGFTCTYHTNGALKEMYNSVRGYTYDTIGNKMTETGYSLGKPTSLTRYTYDANRNLTSLVTYVTFYGDLITDGQPYEKRIMTYDSSNRQTSVTYYDARGLLSSQYQITYDEKGSRTTQYIDCTRETTCVEMDIICDYGYFVEGCISSTPASSAQETQHKRSYTPAEAAQVIGENNTIIFHFQ
ncbi:MAG: hypothetical protein IJ852_02960 [Alphaproteobacteria bacterium]|nr:hypothetical protein [Alphaproteobacteria bacterium]